MNLFFELLQVAVGTRERLSCCPDAAEWNRIQDLAVKQTLVGVLMDGLDRLPAEQRPPKSFLLKWIGLTQYIEQQNAVMDIRTREVVSGLENDGFRCAVLKGRGLAQLYPNPMRRQSGDIDVWVLPNIPSESLDARRVRVVNYLRQKGVKGRVVYHNMPMTLADGTEVEVHFTPSWMNCWFTNRRLQRWFHEYGKQCSEAQPSRELGYRIPSAEFNKVFVLQHIYRHLIVGGIGLRQLMDYFYVLKNSEDDGSSQKVLQRLHLLKFAKALMWVLGEVFGLEQERMLTTPVEKEGRFLLEEVMRAGNFGHYDDRIVVPQNETKLHGFFRNSRQAFRLINHYPEEVIWSPLFRAWHYVWRKCKRYPI